MSARALLLAGLAVSPLVSGCERQAEPAPKPAATPAAAPAVPLSFKQKTADAEATLTLPAELRAHPALHRTLYDKEHATLTSFVEGAKAERAALGLELPPYTLEVTWRVAAETDRLLSLIREEGSYAGGAHPNSSTTTLLWDKQTGREAPSTVLFPTAAAHPDLERRLCDALKAEKAERGGVELTGETWSCPKWKDVQLALAPSATKGDAGGVTALFSPYEVGPYAEGSYEITLPASAVRAAVAPDYRAEFAG